MKARVTLADGSGRIVYGGVLAKEVETGFAMATPGLASASMRSGEEVYAELQQQVALAVARLVSFRLEPLRVIEATGQRIQLNYGAPLLAMGQMVQVAAPDGSFVRYQVTGADQGGAQAALYGGDARSVRIGSIATVIEAEDPEANARRFDRADLP